MDKGSQRCIVLAEIGNDYKVECHIAEIDVRTPLEELIAWARQRDCHLDDALRGKWTYAKIYMLPSSPPRSFDEKLHIVTVHARHRSRW